MATTKTKKKSIKKASKTTKKVNKANANPSSIIANNKSKIAPYKPKKKRKIYECSNEKTFYCCSFAVERTS